MRTRRSRPKTALRRGPLPADAAGFTMIELLSVVTIIILVTFYLFRIGLSQQALSRVQDNDRRMTLVLEAMREYYQTHLRLPDPAGPDGDEVPVAPDRLDLEQRYRYDAWGQPYIYDPGDPASIVDVDDPLTAAVEAYAASLRSSGPDQLLNTADDVVRYLDLNRDAVAHCLEKLAVLQQQVARYNSLFPGIDNDGVFEPPDAVPAIDEDPGEVVATNVEGSTCPPTSNMVNDPADGYTTLDAIEQDAYPACPAPLVEHLAALYHLDTAFPGGYTLDPWGRPMRWGYEGRVLGDGVSVITPTDRRYHRFYSQGPDPADVGDDIVVAGAP